MLIRRIVIGSAAACLAACATSGPAEPPRLQPLWTAYGFQAPEAVLLSTDEAFYYVSNVNGEAGAKDGNGYISRVTREGVVIEERWAENLNAPKGMALDTAGLLWVSDIDRLVALDAGTGRLRRSLAIGRARALDDVATLADGTVLAADPGRGAIYQITESGHRVWSEDPALAGVSALLPEDERLLAVTLEGRILAIGLSGGPISTLANGFGRASGIAPLPRAAGYVIAELDGRLHYIGPEGERAVLLESSAQGVLQNDIAAAGKRTLVAPNWAPGTLSAWTVAK